MEVPTDVRDVLQRQRRQLEQLFAEYCDGPPNVPLKKRVIMEEQFLKLARRYGICPGLMARVEIVQLFRATNRREDLDSECSGRRGWNRRTSGATLGYADFTACLAACAAVIFTGEEWEAKYSTLGQKFGLLLFWLERESCSEKRWKVCQTTRRRDKPRAKDLVAVAARRGVAVDGEEDRPEVLRPSSSGLLEASAERRLRQLFAYYCTCGDRLNVGPHAALKLSQVVRLLADAGCLDTAHSRQRLDVALAAFGGVSRKRLSFEDLIHFLADFASDNANLGGLSAFISRHILLDGPELLPPSLVEPIESHSSRYDLGDSHRSEEEKCLKVNTTKNDPKEQLLAIAAPAPSEDCAIDVFSDAMTSVAGSPVVIGREATCSVKERGVEAAAVSPDFLLATEEIEALKMTMERETHLKQLARDLCVGGFSDAVDSISLELGATKVAGVPLVRSLEPAHKCGGLRELRDRLHSRCKECKEHNVPGERKHYARMRAAAAQGGQPMTAAVGPRELRRLCQLSDEELSRLTAPYDSPRLRTNPLRSLKAKLHTSMLEQVARLRELRDVRRQTVQDRLADSGFHAVKLDASHISVGSALNNGQGDDLRRQQLCVLEAALVDQSCRLAALQSRLGTRFVDDARASDPNAQSDLKLHAECPDEGLDITANQPVRDQATRGFLPPSPTQDRILDVEPVEEPVDRSTWRNVAAVRASPSTRHGWVIAEPNKAEFWSVQTLESERVLGEKSSRRNGFKR